MTTRRHIVFGLCAGVLAAPLAVEAQQPARVFRVGFLSLLPREQALSHIRILQEGLRGLGYVEGQNIILEYRFADEKADLLPDQAAELIRLKVDVIVTGFGTVPALAAKKATNTIPIVFSVVADPVRSGIVSSLARPGGNITGPSTVPAGLVSKRLEILKEIAPKLSRVIVLLNPATPASIQGLAELKLAAEKLGIQLQLLEVRAPPDFESVSAAASPMRADALIVLSDPLTIAHRAQIADFAAKSRLPAMYGIRDFVEAGGLISYGANYDESFRRAASYVDRILKGAKPADLPVEQPTNLELALNLKTAKALGLTIPQSILVRADRVIE